MTSKAFTPPKPSLWLLLRVWLLLGLQSFGGGAATLALIRRAVVEEHAWLSEEDFTNEWALCQIAPGINLFALTILIGRHLAGTKGMVVSLLGLLVPSVTLTLLITAGYARIARLEVVQQALQGIIPASVGLGLVTAQQMAKTSLKASKQEGNGTLALGWLLLGCSGLLVSRWHQPVLRVLFVAASVSALVQWGKSRRKPEVNAP